MTTNETPKPFGPCPLCGGEARIENGYASCPVCLLRCAWDVWTKLSTLADQNKRRGEALERLKREFIHRNEGGSPMFHESNMTLIGWCEEAE